MPASPSPEPIFFAALQKTDAVERAAYLDEACQGDHDLRRRVERLLNAHPQAGNFLEQPVAGNRAGEVSASEERTVAPSTQAVPEEREVGRTEGSGSGAAADVPDYLAPSSTPGSLGRLDHYEIQEVVGSGGMGVVLKAFDEKLRRVVAIKLMAPELAASGVARKRFTREAQAAAAVNHEHVVAIHAVEERHRPPYLVMQFIAGVSLQEKLDREGPLSLKEILRIGLQTAEGLAAAHRQGLVHRDIKPANILLENGIARVKITDFGLARPVDDPGLTQPGLIHGTPAYMSPEQAAGDPVDHRSDLFSLGSVLYALCTGWSPFHPTVMPAVLMRVIEETPRPIAEVNPEIPVWLCDLISRLHAKRPADRLQSAKEVADLLGQYLAHLQEPAQAAMPREVEKPRPQAPARSPRSPRWIAAGILLLGLGVGLFLAHRAGWFSGPSDPTPSLRPGQVSDAERKAAEYVLAIEGKVKVNDEDTEIKVAAALPPEAFRLTYVDLTENKRVSNSGLAFFKGCTNLRNLILGSTGVSDAGLVHFKDCKNLTQLDLSGTQVKDEDLDYFKGCNDLAFLDLGATQLGDAGLVNFKGCKKLAGLWLQDTIVGDAGLANFSDLKELEFLWLDSTKVTNEGLKHFKECKNLTELSLYGTSVGDPGLLYFKDCKDLTILDLSETQVRDAGLAHFRSCKDLTELRLNNTQVTDAGLEHFKECKNLTELSLTGTSVSDLGLEHFKGCTDLTILDLSETQVRDAGLAHFRGCKELKELRLNNTQLTDAGLAPFLDCIFLTSLQVQQTKVTPAKIDELKKALPQCKIEWDGGVIGPTAPTK